MTDDNENTVLHNASCNMNIIKCLIDHGANVDAKNCMGDIPLFRFVKRYNSSKTLNWNDILKIFKFSKHTTKQNKKTLLHLAVIGYHSDLVKLLIADYQVEINQTDALQRTPLDALFIETKSSSYFENTVVNKIIATLKQLLQHEARFNVVESLKDIPGFLLLQNAAKANDMQLFSWLLQNGASVSNVLDTSLHRAIAKCFLKSGKLTNSDTSELVLLNYAVDNDEMELLEWLLQSGINVNSTSADSCYETALFTAIVKENVKATEILVKYNADVNIRNVFGDTASVKLIQQACKNNTDVNTLSKILDLLKCEETSATTDSIGNTLLHWASSWKRHKLVILLADKFKFNVNKQNFEGNTPLHEVILWLNDTSNMEDVRNTVEALKIFGARLNLKNNNLETALEMLQKERKHFSGLNLKNLIKLLKDDYNDDLGTANVN